MFDKIRRTIQKIPRGKVATYGQIATLAGFPGAARQVVWALHSSHGLPWHRVIGANGKILLTGNNALEQRMRLEMEGVQFIGARVDLKSFQWKLTNVSKKGTTIRRKS
ncbi:MAG TPA: MGMT family protein [Terriglobales bacterium]|nr:MGMT family protein [Terriglobales bacterium]